MAPLLLGLKLLLLIFRLLLVFFFVPSAALVELFECSHDFMEDKPEKDKAGEH